MMVHPVALDAAACEMRARFIIRRDMQGARPVVVNRELDAARQEWSELPAHVKKHWEDQAHPVLIAAELEGNG